MRQIFKCTILNKAGSRHVTIYFDLILIHLFHIFLFYFIYEIYIFVITIVIISSMTESMNSEIDIVIINVT